MTRPAGATVRAVLPAAAARLAAAGVPTPRVDAELLLAHVLDVRRGALLTAPDPTAAQHAAFDRLVDARARRVPLQHLTGRAPFRHLDLLVGPGVFVPRPETELLVDAALPVLLSLRDPVVVDLAAGSGALGLAVADEVPGARVTLVESDPGALIWLRRNAAGADVQVVPGDLRDPAMLRGSSGRVDVVLSNPPYVPAATPVDPEVGHDPAGAVFAGADGLALLPEVVAAAARLLRPGGLLVVEHDDTHREAVPGLLAAPDWADVRDHDDLTGRPRYATAVRAAVRGIDRGTDCGPFAARAGATGP